jgi:arylsulfatase A-like enzyme
MILSDDLGYADLGHDGSGIDTPNLDRMRTQGVKLTQFYAGAPICSPSRAALLTGRYPHAVGVPELCSPAPRGQVDILHLDLDAVTIPELLKGRDYASMLAGKWHLGYPEESWPRRHGFDEFWGSLAGTPKFFEPVETYHNEEAITVEGGYYTDHITDAALRFLSMQTRRRPFFLYLAYNAPHYPLEAPEALVEKYKQEFEDEKFATYAAMLDTLEARGLAQNTLVVFTSDNGPSPEPPAYGLPGARRSAGPLKGHKFSAHEGGIRVPFLAKWPGAIPANSTMDDTAIMMDLLPTFAEAAGLDAPEECDGRSLLSLLGGTPRPLDRSLHWELQSNFGVRAGEWKLVHELWREAPFLYHLSEDLGENSDLASQRPEKVQELIKLHDTWRATRFPVQYEPPTKRSNWLFPEE